MKENPTLRNTRNHTLRNKRNHTKDKSNYPDFKKMNSNKRPNPLHVFLPL